MRKPAALVYFADQRPVIDFSDEHAAETEVGRYTKGSHRVIFQLQYFLRLLEVHPAFGLSISRGIYCHNCSVTAGIRSVRTSFAGNRL